MGCCSSNSASNDHGISGCSARRYFYLEDLPLSVRVAEPRHAQSASSQQGFDLLVAGMSRPGLVPALESGIARRPFELVSADWAVEGSMFHGTFYLRPDKASAMNATPESTPPKCLAFQNVQQKDCVPGILAFSVDFGGHGPTRREVCIRVSHTLGTPLRAGLLGIMERLGGRLVRGQMLSFPSFREQFPAHWQDTIWAIGDKVFVGCLRDKLGTPSALLMRVKEEQELSIETAYLDKVDICACDGSILESITEETNRTPKEGLSPAKSSPSKRAGWTTPTKLKAVTTSFDLCSTFRQLDLEEISSCAKTMPRALRREVQRKPYLLRGPVDWGTQVDGYSKYMGAGLTSVPAFRGKLVTLSNKLEIAKAPLLEFTTFFIAKRGSQRADPSGQNDCGDRNAIAEDRALLGLENHAEFVTKMDISNKRLFISKVFLVDDVLTRTRSRSQRLGSVTARLGAQAVAEQLFAPVWESGASGPGDLLKVHDLCEIVIEDVINWNTYALMRLAHQREPPASRVPAFEDHLEWSIDEELQLVELTRTDARDRSYVDLLQATCLGKLITQVFEIWQQRCGVRHIMRDARLEFRETRDQTGIRQAMYVFIQVTPKLLSNHDLQLHLANEIPSPPSESLEAFRSATTSPGTTPKISVAVPPHFAGASMMGAEQQLRLKSWVAGPMFASLDLEVARRRTILNLNRHIHGCRQLVDKKHDASPTHHSCDCQSVSPAANASPIGLRRLVVAISKLVHDIQLEQNMSCHAVASKAGADGRLGGCASTKICLDAPVSDIESSLKASPGVVAEVTARRKATDKRLSDASLQCKSYVCENEEQTISTSCTLCSCLGASALGVPRLQMDEISRMVASQRRIVDEELAACRVLSTIERHRLLCLHDESFLLVLALLLEWLADAGSVAFASRGDCDDDDDDAGDVETEHSKSASQDHVTDVYPYADSFSLLLLFKEQLSQESALVLSADQRSPELVNDPDLLRNCESLTVSRSVIGDLLLAHAEIGPLLRHLAVVEATLLTPASPVQPGRTRPPQEKSEARRLGDAVTRCMDQCQKLILHTLGERPTAGDESHLFLGALYLHAHANGF